MKKKKDKNSISSLKKELDRVFSIFIRKRDKGVCFTCGTRKPWKYMQNGHFVSRQYLSIRWDETNCNCQCAGCNVFKHGNMVEYSLRMIEKYGLEYIEELNKKKNQITKLDKAWYLTQIEHYKKLID